MAAGPNHCGTYDYNCKVSFHWASSVNGRTTGEAQDMEVKGPTITAVGHGGPDLQGCGDSKQRAERLSELQERRRGLQTLLSARLGELRRVCLLEAELTGEIPREFPLEAGERPPHVRRRSGLAHHAPKHGGKGEEEEVCQRKPKKALFSAALRRQTDSEQHPSQGKRTVHRGCHTDDMVKSESSSMSDSTGQDNEESSSAVTPDGLSPTRPRLAPGSPDSRLSRKLSPVEVYYEMRTRRNSMASSASPSRSLPRSISNVEGRSVPATPLLGRNGPTSIHIRSDVTGVVGVKHWPDVPDGPQSLPPLQSSQDGSSSGSFERTGCPYGARTRRSNSSEALLDRAAVFPPEEAPGAGGPQRSGMPARGGPYKSSEALTDGRLRQVRVSPERQLNGHVELGRVRSSVGGRGGGGVSGGGGGGGYNEILMDYIWGKQQKMQQQQQQAQRQLAGVGGSGRAWPPDGPQPPPPLPPGSASSPHYNGFPPSSQQQQPLPPHFGAGPPPYSPLLLRGKPGDPRRVKVTRTKSCGPFVPLPPPHHQGEPLLLSSAPPHAPAPGPYPYAAEPLAPPPRRPPPFPEDPTRSLHKALALEGLRDWYLRNTLGQPAAAAGGPAKLQDPGAPPRRRTPPSSLHGSHQQPQSFPGEHAYGHLPQSATFHGHPLHGRSVELSLYQESFPAQMQELSLKEPNTDLPAPGTLV